jgi:hypothetical protein
MRNSIFTAAPSASFRRKAVLHETNEHGKKHKPEQTRESLAHTTGTESD